MAPETTLPTIEVIGTTPLPGVGIDRDKVPSNVQDRSAVFTSPQKFHNTLLMLSLNANYFATDTLSFQGNFYVRNATREAPNGNTTDAQVSANPTLLSFGDDVTPLIDTNGAQVPSSVLHGGIPGEIDSSSINSLGLGGSLQGTETAQLFGHNNYLVVGASLDDGRWPIQSRPHPSHGQDR